MKIPLERRNAKWAREVFCSLNCIHFHWINIQDNSVARKEWKTRERNTQLKWPHHRKTVWLVAYVLRPSEKEVYPPYENVCHFRFSIQLIKTNIAVFGFFACYFYPIAWLVFIIKFTLIEFQSLIEFIIRLVSDCFPIIFFLFKPIYKNRTLSNRSDAKWTAKNGIAMDEECEEFSIGLIKTCVITVRIGK